MGLRGPTSKGGGEGMGRRSERTRKRRRGLYVLLALISFFSLFFGYLFFKDFSENNYLRIRWTDFRSLFTE